MTDVFTIAPGHYTSHSERRVSSIKCVRDCAEDPDKEYQLMAAPRGLVRTVAAGSLASLTLLSTLLTIAHAQPLAPLERSVDVPFEPESPFTLKAPFASKRPSPVLIDVGRGVGPILEWRLRLSFQLDYLDLPLIPRRGPGFFAFVGISTQSLGGFRLHF